MKKPTKAVVKPAAKATTVATKRPRTYKKADLPRTARAYLGKKYNAHMDKENEAVAKLIEIHEAKEKELEKLYAANIYPLPAAEPAFVFAPESRKLTLREKFLAWIGAR
jgi:hypothetical protein